MVAKKRARGVRDARIVARRRPRSWIAGALALILVAAGGYALDAAGAPPASAESGVEGTTVQIPQRWYSYVSPGESFQLRSAFRTNTGANGGDLYTKWVVYAPDGSTAWE
ncbi:hypothetical protein [Mycetocola saprophilus]|uniref:hypothetical protein n=1 Tax=Mycetocola saprophilus TaxID=76636 RepID=UPI003BF5CB73